jgi:hypothetical protein
MSTGQPGTPAQRVFGRAAREVAIYGVLLSAAVFIYLLVHAYGERLPMPGRPAAQLGVAAGPPGGHDADVMLHILIALSVIIAVARIGGIIFRFLRQPAVIGEIVAGIMLGPSLLGRIWPAAFGYLLPPLIAPFLDVLAQLGIILYMFLVGLELDPRSCPQWAGCGGDFARQYCGSIPTRDGACVEALSRSGHGGYPVHRLFAVRRRLDVGNGVPGAVADFERSWPEQDLARDHGAHLRGGSMT